VTCFNVQAAIQEEVDVTSQVCISECAKRLSDRHPDQVAAPVEAKAAYIGFPVAENGRQITFSFITPAYDEVGMLRH
jgi:hypothetical protein